jgi:simple sugar transport system permease protein
VNEFDFSMITAGVVAGAAPIVLAAIGETVTEKSGLINLSLDGSILLAAMVSFVAALKTGSLLAGFVAGALVGRRLLPSWPCSAFSCCNTRWP